MGRGSGVGSVSGAGGERPAIVNRHSGARWGVGQVVRTAVRPGYTLPIPGSRPNFQPNPAATGEPMTIETARANDYRGALARLP